ncbi:hypothetical protein ZIOFF_048164 [Zingiber officinale]|uniref:CCHC-type domain-containing protein n=1 Tax=Zingiber officinale TaxID=94328 RepID=A0A8J5KRX3_ZINOF|nr:hypothetical protein ZIOFF_048164 [Zingiber officinale]
MPNDLIRGPNPKIVEVLFFLPFPIHLSQRMISLPSWKSPGSLVAAIGFLLILVSFAHMFLPPLLPSFDYFGGRNERLSGGGASEDLGTRSPATSHVPVAYRGAPWKAEIGRWLSRCDPLSVAVEVVENISDMICKDECGGRGVCNRELGQCRCFHGYAGLHIPKTSLPLAQKHCLHVFNHFTKVLAFSSPSKPGDPKVTNWTKADFENIFTTNGSKPGWCNVDPEDAYASKVKFKVECDCKYDCLLGQFCEIPTLCSCVNQCSGHGHCRGGFCECDRGYYGIDCSVPSALSPMQDWPVWLRPAKVDLPDKVSINGELMTIKAVVKKKRPLIYVYDLPPEFNAHLLEGRHFKFECVNRIYTDKNRTLWTDQLYGSQMALYESILASPYRTMNGDEADFLYVPVLDSCIITRADDAPHLRMKEQKGLRSYFALEFYKRVYDHIVEKYPYWNRSAGKDHIWFFSWDEGACYAPKEIWNSTMLVHWGNTNSKHNHSTTAYWADNWDPIPSSKTGTHPCFDPEKDLVLPAWKRPEPGAIWAKLWARPRKERTTLFYFNGNLGPAYENGRPEDTYSMGIRQKLAEEFGSTPNKAGKFGRQHTPNVTVTNIRSSKYYDDVASSIFCGVLPGDGWSGRLEDSILQGCIPVIIQKSSSPNYSSSWKDKPKKEGSSSNSKEAASTKKPIPTTSSSTSKSRDIKCFRCLGKGHIASECPNKKTMVDGIYLPYENALDYSSFSVRIQEDEITNLLQILQRLDETEIDLMLANLHQIWQRFLYRDSVLLEAQRQKKIFPDEEGWAVEFSKLEEDDVFATFIQILHYKLHNDPWRRNLARARDYGMPNACLRRKL